MHIKLPLVVWIFGDQSIVPPHCSSLIPFVCALLVMDQIRLLWALQFMANFGLAYLGLACLGLNCLWYQHLIRACSGSIKTYS